eukprot:524853-Alexandrium_andersonii.AAC.1
MITGLCASAAVCHKGKCQTISQAMRGTLRIATDPRNALGQAPMCCARGHLPKCPRVEQRMP